jgi:tetratricopeptide (TPR) repeat protein/TolB-like protein
VADQMDRLEAALADRYTLVRELGRGGMATVYLARDVRHDRPVALKVLRPELAAALGPERFLREIRTTAQLAHPHILPLHDSGSAAEFLYYVMPYVEGESLRERLNREKQLPLEDALRLAREVADALSYAHGHGLIHRDIKPENILLQAGHAVVADFGIARAVTEAGGKRLTETGLAVGTPAYMSPEQAAGSGDLDGRSDVYALGCVLYEMLAGEPPFTGPTVESLVHQHLAVEPQAVTAIRPAVPAPVAAALHRTLAKAPADRFQSAAAFAGAIAQSTAATPAAESRAFHRRLAPPIAIGLVVIAAVMLWVLRPWRGASAGDAGRDEASRVVVLPYENRTGDPDLDPVGQMVAEWITEGLMQTGSVQVVPNFMALEAVAQSRDGGGGLLDRVAERTQASLAVTGSYYRHGEQLEFHSEVMDVASGTSFARIDPISGTARDPRGAIDSVRIQVMGALVIRLSRDLGWELPPGVQPPTYDAARVYGLGMREWVHTQYDSAATLFARAYALDTTYLRSLMLAVAAYGNAGDRRRGDSLMDIVQARRDELSPYDRYRVTYLAAIRRGDTEEALAAARAGVELVPFGTLRWALVGALVSVNRPREALAVLEGTDASLVEVAAAWDYVWRARTEVLHLLGLHERELEVARESRNYLTGALFAMSYEGAAIAALGRVEDLLRLTGEVRTAAPVPLLTPGEVLIGFVEEARAHGDRGTAIEIAGQALQWLDEHPETYRASVAGRSLLGRLLYLRERWDEADTVFAALQADPATATNALGYRGVIAARRGDVAAARRFADALAELPQREQRGRNVAWRARIAALLGERGEAVALLRRAFGEGLGYGIWLHRDVDLESLRDYPPFQELVRPKG